MACVVSMNYDLLRAILLSPTVKKKLNEINKNVLFCISKKCIWKCKNKALDAA